MGKKRAVDNVGGCKLGIKIDNVLQLVKWSKLRELIRINMTKAVEENLKNFITINNEMKVQTCK